MTLDPAALVDMLAMVGDDPEFVGEIVDTYLADAPTQLAGMRTALADGDAVTLGRLAHTLKGNSRNVGAVALAEIARTLEEQARAEDLADAGPRIAAADDELARVVTALDAVRATGWQP
ncbi:MAG: Hpt domain-containing protein [Candidatus Limnocylindrales bacterium]